MRICYLGDDDNVHDLRFLEKLVEKGYETHVVSLQEPVGIKGITYHKLAPYNYYSLGTIRGVPELIKARQALRKVIKEIKPDILHSGWIPTYGFLAAVTGFHPFLLSPWGSDILILPKSSIIRRFATRFAIKQADMILCDCLAVRDEIVKLSRYPQNKIAVFPWGINLKKFTPELDRLEIRSNLGWQDKRILIMTRNFKPVYGIEYFLKALRNIVKRVPDARVILCGQGPLEGEFRDFIEKEELQEYVHFAGSVGNDDLPRYLVAADIYISSSLSDGTSLSLLEAMACGLPVVVSDVPANMEWINDSENGFVTPREESTILGERITELLRNEELRHEFGKRNFQIAKEQADWDRNFEKLEWMYQQLSKKGD